MTQLTEVEARVEKIYPAVTKDTSKWQFTTQKVLIVFNEDNEYPSKIVLEQASSKMEIVEKIKEWQTYLFSLNFRGNDWTDPKTGIPTAFGSISAWRVQDVDGNEPASEKETELPF